ncbi:MAG: transcription antitermination factor NusB [Candidatus Kapaibacterium sp.]
MKKRAIPQPEEFPLSRTRSIDGTRRLAREKAVQILSAYESMISESPDVQSVDTEHMFQHIFYRDFNIGEGEEQRHGRPLRTDEVEELESDTPITWRDKDIHFARTLFFTTVANVKSLDERIERLAKNWDLERIALTDRLLLRMAITEMMTFSDIVPKITINEAIELAKVYSTEKSSVFINGILDVARDELVAEGLLASKSENEPPTASVE